MSEPFLAEIRIFGFNFPPRGYAACDGALLPISQNQSLFSLLGTTYGGDGRTDFALPELRGRSPLHVGDGISQGTRAGQQSVQLTNAQVPQHDHALQASADVASSPSPVGNVLAKKARGGNDVYSEPMNLVGMHSGVVSSWGGSQSHENMQPFLTINFCIAVVGTFPSRN
jgi:microcystin-dependent protein